MLCSLQSTSGTPVSCGCQRVLTITDKLYPGVFYVGLVRAVAHESDDLEIYGDWSMQHIFLVKGKSNSHWSVWITKENAPMVYYKYHT